MTYPHNAIYTNGKRPVSKRLAQCGALYPYNPRPVKTTNSRINPCKIINAS